MPDNEVIHVPSTVFGKRLLLSTYEIVRALNHDHYRLFYNDRYYIYLNISEHNTMLARAIGFFEQRKFAFLDRFLRPGDVFFDLGGNKGDFSLFAATLVKRHGRVYCFEPLPDNVSWIKRSVKKNGFTNVDVIEVCVTDRAGEISLYVGKKSGWSSIFEKDYQTEQLICEAVTLDDFVQSNRVSSVSVMKIDIEGAELKALAGAKHVLSNARPIIMLDLHRGIVGDSGLAELWAIGNKFNYAIFNDRDMSRPSSPDKIGHSMLAVPDERVNDVLSIANELISSKKKKVSHAEKPGVARNGRNNIIDWAYRTIRRRISGV